MRTRPCGTFGPPFAMPDAARTLRTAERYLLQPPLAAHFGGRAVSICDISAKGTRFTHGHSLETGQKSLLRVALNGRPAPVQLEAVGGWAGGRPPLPSRLASRGPTVR